MIYDNAKAFFCYIILAGVFAVDSNKSFRLTEENSSNSFVTKLQKKFLILQAKLAGVKLLFARF